MKYLQLFFLFLVSLQLFCYFLRFPFLYFLDLFQFFLIFHRFSENRDVKNILGHLMFPLTQNTQNNMQLVLE